MDRGKRRANLEPNSQPPSSMVDLGSTPPQNVAHTYIEESAIRSTIATHQRSATPPPEIVHEFPPVALHTPRWTAINQPAEPPRPDFDADFRMFESPENSLNTSANSLRAELPDLAPSESIEEASGHTSNPLTEPAISNSPDCSCYESESDCSCYQSEEAPSPDNQDNQQQVLQPESDDRSEGDSSRQSSAGIVIRSGGHRVDDDATGAYMINAENGSYTGSLPSEADPDVQRSVPPQTILLLKHLKRQQEAKDHEEGGELANAAAQILKECQPMQTLEENAKAHKDFLLRNVIRRINQKLKEGSVLTVERRGVVTSPIDCAYPHCRAPNKCVPNEAYYVILGKPRELEHSLRYCLFCIEGLWNGKGLTGPLPAPQVPVADTQATNQGPSWNLDGAMDDLRSMATAFDDDPATPNTSTSCTLSHGRSPSHASSSPGTLRSGSPITALASSNEVYEENSRAKLDGSEKPSSSLQQPTFTLPRNHAVFSGPASLLASKWAPKPDTEPSARQLDSHTRTPSPPLPPLPETPGEPVSSPASRNSSGEWHSPPTRFQHLAKYIQSGNTLSAKEKAAVELWKAASKEQLDWLRHLERADQIRRKYGALLDAGSESEQEEDQSDTETLRADSVREEGEVALKGKEIAGNEETVGDEVLDEAENDEEDIWEQRAGLSRKQCRGKDLTAVLAEIRAREE